MPSGRPDPDEESEGCLSVPGEHFPLRRAETAKVNGQDLTGAPFEFTATDWFARCMQHEFDHLNGKLYVDRLDDKQTRQARKAIKNNGWGKPGHSWMPGADPDPFGHEMCIRDSTGTTAIFINQLREKIGVMFGSPETTTGGKALKFYASVRLDVRRIETLKDGSEAVSYTHLDVYKRQLRPTPAGSVRCPRWCAARRWRTSSCLSLIHI